jgi:hypothetical protein
LNGTMHYTTEPAAAPRALVFEKFVSTRA